MTQASWAEEEMADARLCDERFRTNLARMVEALHDQCGAHFSAAVGPALRQSAVRLLSDEDTRLDKLLAGHLQQTLRRCQTYERVLVAQDTTSLNFSSHPATEGLGPISDKQGVHGLLVHDTLVVSPEGLPLGAPWALTWARASEEDAPLTHRRERPITQKESNRWLKICRRVQLEFEPYLEAGGRVTLVQDREADIFELLALPRHPNLDLIVRAAHPRTVEIVAEGKRSALFQAVEAAPVLGEYAVRVPAQTGQPERVALLKVRVTQVRIQPPRQGVGHTQEPIAIWVVQASEGTAKGLNWTLICTREVTTFEAACEVVRDYKARWGIERLHLTLKSGCNVERLQMDDVHTLVNGLALYLVVAWHLLYLTHLGRICPLLPAEAVVTGSELEVLCSCAPHPVTTVAEVIREIARLGGYTPYRNARPPGVQVLWRGLRRLEDMTAGWLLARGMTDPHLSR
jgi:hypothetical protein